MHNKNARRNKNNPNKEDTTYRWYLSEFKGENVMFLMEGIYQFPVSDIGKGLTAEWVLLHLQHEKCFDFDYTPGQGDTLIINQPSNPNFYLSFIYENKIWKEGHYSSFQYITKLKHMGEVKTVQNEQ